MAYCHVCILILQPRSEGLPLLLLEALTITNSEVPLPKAVNQGVGWGRHKEQSPVQAINLLLLSLNDKA